MSQRDTEDVILADVLNGQVLRKLALIVVGSAALLAVTLIGAAWFVGSRVEQLSGIIQSK